MLSFMRRKWRSHRNLLGSAFVILVLYAMTLRARLNDMEDRLSPTQLHDEAGKGAIAEDDSLGTNPRKS